MNGINWIDDMLLMRLTDRTERYTQPKQYYRLEPRLISQYGSFRYWRLHVRDRY